MKFKYQLIITGQNHPLRSIILKRLSDRVSDLGLADDVIVVLEGGNYSDYKVNFPTVGLYFGQDSISDSDLTILNTLIGDSAFILPVVPELDDFPKLVPKELLPINGFKLNSEDHIDALVSCILEGFSLLRLARRLFISYRRKESRAAAIQLYEYLDQRGFDVFLDTHSIRPGEPFQDELWHRMVDTDVVVLLNTPDFLGSIWTTEELAQASAMSIGVIQLIWPKYTPSSMAALCQPLYLSESDFDAGLYADPKAQLTDKTLITIAAEVESLRARSLASRQDNLIKEFNAVARKEKKTAVLQPEKFFTVETSAGTEVAVIPTVGVPQAFTYNQSEELVKRIREHKTKEAFLLFDQRNIKEQWQKHLSWLDQYLPVKTLKVTELEKWFQKI
jgi:hypothetical protein